MEQHIMNEQQNVNEPQWADGVHEATLMNDQPLQQPGIHLFC